MKTLKQLQEKWEHDFSGPHKFNTDGAMDYDQLQHVDPDEIHYVDKLHTSLSKHYKFTAKEGKPIREYTDDSAELNHYMLHKSGVSTEIKDVLPEDQATLTRWSDDLNQSLTKHRTPHDLHVYSGVSYNPASIGENHGKIIKVHLPAFTSTSIHPHTAIYFGSPERPEGSNDPYTYHMIKIHVPAGSRGSYVAHKSYTADEREFILPKDAKLHIHPEPTSFTHRFRRWGNDVTTKIWHAKLVHDGTEPTRHMNEDA